MSLRLAFMGSPDFAVPSLKALIEAGHEIACVYTQPPRPAGRGRRERKTPVHEVAEAHGLAVRTPRSLKRPKAQAAFAGLQFDLACVVAYGLILPKPILDAPRLGCINLHGSLLPRWRGAAPIQRALMAGDRATGVEVMRMEEGLDTGAIILSARIEIAPDDTAQSLHDRMASAGAPLLVEAVGQLEEGRAVETPQAATGVTYAEKITPSETKIDWSRPAREIDLKIRGLSPAPGAWFHLPTDNGAVRVKALNSVLSLGQGAPGEALDDRLLIACGEGAVRLLAVQREGKDAMAANAFLHGQSVPAGTRLT